MAVVAGEIVAGPHVRNSCQRHLQDLDDAHKRGLIWDVDAAQRAFDFFAEVLRLNGGQFEGVPFFLHPAQSFIVGSLFGWKRADGRRRFRRAYVEQGKGNGKSPLAGGIGLYGLVADGEDRAEVYAVAAKMEQARILFRDAVAMVDQSPSLSQRLHKTGINPVNRISWEERESFFCPLGRDTGKTGSGLRPYFVLADEVHEHPDRSTLEMMERGFKGRRQPLLLMITNSGSDRNSVCWEEHEHAVKVASGEIEDDTAFSYVCAVDKDDKPLEDPSCWVKANPLLGVTITEEYLADVAKQARRIPGRANGIRRLHFCEWTDSETAWVSMASWQACEDPTMRLEDFDGAECWMGLDLGAKHDMTALGLLFEDGEDKEGRPCYALFARGWTPGDTLHDRAEQDNADYSSWVDAGWLTATPGPLVRQDYVAADLVRLAERFVIVALAYDRWLYNDFAQHLDELGVSLPVIEHPQSISRRKDSPLWMPGSINAFEAMILEGRLRVEPNIALRSAVMSATMWESPAGLRRFEKQRATGRIDMAVASAMAAGAATAEIEGGATVIGDDYRIFA